MSPIPRPILARMEKNANKIIFALSHLEGFLKVFDYSLYSRHPKREVVHDLTLMLAFNDLAEIGVQVLNRVGQPLSEHRVQLKRRPIAAAFLEMMADESKPCFDFKLEDAEAHSGVVVYDPKMVTYRQWLLIPWEIHRAAISPPSLSRSNLETATRASRTAKAIRRVVRTGLSVSTRRKSLARLAPPPK